MIDLSGIVRQDSRRALILAFDHCRTDGVLPGGERPAELISKVSAAGVDALMTNFGVLKLLRPKLEALPPIIMRLDGGNTHKSREWLRYDRWSLLYRLEEAVELGARAGIVMMMLGSETELATLEIVAKTAVEAERIGVPLFVEALPCPGPAIPDPEDARLMADAARIAFEHGADGIKNHFTGSEKTYRKVVEGCPVPVFVAGGAKKDYEKEFLEGVKHAVSSGAAGAFIGRNIWQHESPEKMTKALCAVIHENRTIEEAIALL